ncbi:RraA family protein [Fodinicurvata sp. EGI_FJ10296]|uniref:RraA family protein n=1 Tax=Fodinicurvata sp. EGI_FJ10296 TaxID=3231908 RepID=UPI003453C011
MFKINPMPEAVTTARLEKLRQVETATVGHFLHSGFMDPELRAVLPGRRVAGTAVTLRLPHADSTLLHYAMKLIRPGDFLVIDRAGDRRHACWGGVITHTLARIGIAGGVVDGPVTDIADFAKKDLPVWATGPSPITTKLLGTEGQMNVAVSCGGVVVNPGDAVLADENGIIVLNPDTVDAVADRAIGMQEREITLLQRIDAGEHLPDISGATEKVENALA